MKKIITFALLIFTVVTTFSQTNDTIAAEFSPNGDGIKDYYIFTFKNGKKMDVVINDIQGNVIFKSDGSKEVKWDGTDLEGKPAKDGIYFYSSKGIGNDNKEYSIKGKIKLKR